MGKKRKVKDQKPYAGNVVSTGEEVTKKNQMKTYSLNSTEKKSKEFEDGIFKVEIPKEKEDLLLDLILESKNNLTIKGSVSKRLSTKKLTDLYNTLENAGFKHGQIENAMSQTVCYGGDLIDALDWLCLNTQNDELPEGFSQILSEQEEKQRPKFDASSVSTHSVQSDPIRQNASVTGVQKGETLTKDKTKSSQKEWILKYATQESDSEEDDGSNSAIANVDDIDVNDRYLELCAKVEDLKVQASESKKSGDKVANKEISKRISNLRQEIQRIEEHPDFDGMMKICGVVPGSNQSRVSDLAVTSNDIDTAVTDTDIHSPVTGSDIHAPVTGSDIHTPVTDTDINSMEEDGAMAAFSMFEEQAKTETPKKAASTQQQKLDVRQFEYTRKQWTGKSPKQFLIDWVRKHLPKSPPPKYHKVRVTGSLWKTRCVVLQKEDTLDVVPEIVCENVKDAEHVASVLALYHLCHGQKIYQLLPPPYRDVWLEWQDAEKKQLEDHKEKQNKPRDQFVKKLMKKLKIAESSSRAEDDVGMSGEQEEAEESWEDRLDWDEDVEPQIEQRCSDSDKKSTSHSQQYSDADLLRILNKHQSSAKHLDLLETRQQLPVYQYREKILEEVKRQSVVVIAGETGSGKSTQIPQFILEDIISSELGSAGSVICTQPRRISTISLASRVCDEIGGGAPGSHQSLCGYQIRFEVKRTPSTRLLYCTTGVLLRKLQQDPQLQGVSHIIVDEVHERSVQSDFLLIILKKLLQQRKQLKVILMSATLDADKFSAYFQYCPVVQIPGRTFPVQVCHLEDIIETTDYSLEEDSQYAIRYENLVKEDHAQVSITQKGGDSSKMDVAWTKDDYHSIDRSGLDSSKYSLKTRNTVTRMYSDRINMEIIVELLLKLDTLPQYCGLSGAFLVFLPGLSHIQQLYELLTTDKHFADSKKYKIIALHSVLSSQDQSAAFVVPPAGVRKVVIATNIAETGITIPDVVFVVDSGKVKENRYIESSQMSTLEEVYVSKASAKQRQGRAGRVRPGHCFRLYTKLQYDAMRAYSVPEILRVPLEELCLHIMKCELGDPADLLSQAVEPPSVSSVNRAMDTLREVGACRHGAVLTALGQHLATLPLNVRVGKMLIYAAMLGCLDAISVIGAAMTEKSPFVVPLGKKSEVDLAKSALSTANSDHITLLRAYIGWKIAQKSGYEAEIQYCNKYFLKRSTLLDIQNVSKDLKKLIGSIGFDSIDAHSVLMQGKSVKRASSHGGVLNISETRNSNSLDQQLSPPIIAIVKAVLTAGLYPNVAKITHTPAVDAAANPVQNVCLGQTSQGCVSAHPASVNRFLAANGFLVYHEKVKGAQVYIRDSTLVSCYPLLLFGGDIGVQHKDKLLVVDEFLQFKAYAKTGVIFKELKTLLDNLLERKLTNPNLNLKDEKLVYQLLDLIVAEK